jgi:class 3 adenylate cyclase
LDLVEGLLVGGVRLLQLVVHEMAEAKERPNVAVVRFNVQQALVVFGSLRKLLSLAQQMASLQQARQRVRIVAQCRLVGC